LCAIDKEIRAHGARVLVIGNGEPHELAAFRAETAAPFELVTDPARHSYRAAGLRRAWYRLLDPRVMLSVGRARRAGARQTKVAGDPLQLGGVLVFDASGRLAWRHDSGFPGDHAPPANILKALAFDV
jgi:hypothetical protein